MKRKTKLHSITWSRSPYEHGHKSAWKIK